MGRLRLIAGALAVLVWFTTLQIVEAQSPAPGIWTLAKIDRVAHVGQFGAITAEHFDAQGGSVDVAIDGKALDLCSGGSETMHFDWQFPQDITHFDNGGSRAIVVEAKPLLANKPCTGALADASTIAASSSGSWPYDTERTQIDVDRVGINGPFKAWAKVSGETRDSPGIVFAPWPLKTDQPYTYFFVAISMRGAGEVDYVYMYKAGIAGNLTMVPNLDLPGSDYTHFDSASAQACQMSCGVDPQCKAYTFVNPGVQAPAGQCWLKSVVPAPRTSECCTSGVRE